MAVIGQRNNFRLGFWAFTLMEESSEPCATLSRKISGTRLFSFRFPLSDFQNRFSKMVVYRQIWPQMKTAWRAVASEGGMGRISAFAFPLSGAHSLPWQQIALSVGTNPSIVP